MDYGVIIYGDFLIKRKTAYYESSLPSLIAGRGRDCVVGRLLGSTNEMVVGGGEEGWWSQRFHLAITSFGDKDTTTVCGGVLIWKKNSTMSVPKHCVLDTFMRQSWFSCAEPHLQEPRVAVCTEKAIC